jgi:hypothetical protein
MAFNEATVEQLSDDDLLISFSAASYNHYEFANEECSKEFRDLRAEVLKRMETQCRHESTKNT